MTEEPVLQTFIRPCPSKIVYPTETLSLCRDSTDNMILECCHAAKANILITGDRDLLEIAELLFDLQLMMPREFVEERSRHTDQAVSSEAFPHQFVSASLFSWSPAQRWVAYRTLGRYDMVPLEWKIRHQAY
ncbi:MAG TPA: putative toxin-antitoxin system toxin component, PIN family [Patescibacteria group bacterium]|nr:putative toxin-antitoxin system toxin component, PIN family [Patescibacteria group bacterium]